MSAPHPGYGPAPGQRPDRIPAPTGPGGRPADQRADRIPAPAEPTGPDRSGGDRPASSSEWRRVHPLTPLLHGGAVILGILGVTVYNLIDTIGRIIRDLIRGDDSIGRAIADHPGIVAAVVGGLLLVLLALGAYLYLAWRAERYRLDEDSIDLRQGLLAKRQRSARFDRVQSVDINQRFLPRMLGLAALVFDVAGGDDSNITLSYLSRAKAEALRDEILARVRSARASQPAHAPEPGAPAGDGLGGPARGPGPAPETSSAPGGSAGMRAAARGARSSPLGAKVLARTGHLIEETATGVSDDVSRTLTEVLAPYRVRAQAGESGQLIRVPLHRVIAAAFLSGGFVIGVLILVALVIVAVVLTVVFGMEAGAGMFGGLIPAAIAIFGAAVSSISHGNFAVALTPDGLRVSAGVFSTTRRVIPVDRIQAVRLNQPLLWRIPGWWKAEFTQATKPGSDSQGTGSVLLPVGTLDDALLMMGLALPDPAPTDGVSARALVVEGLSGPLPESAGAEAVAASRQYIGRPSRSRWLDPFVQPRRAHAVTPTMTIIRSGVLTRVADFVPHARVQSMRWRQGPIQRALDLGTVGLHISAGPVHPAIVHLGAADSHRFLAEHAETTRRARRELDEAGA